MSDLNAIYTALATHTIAMANGEQIPAWNLDEVKAVVPSVSLPIRLLLPPGAAGDSGIEAFEMVTLKKAQVIWRVTELMLYQTVGRGGGIQNIWARLTEYISRYVTYFSANRRLTGTATIVNFRPTANVLQWPEGGEWYHGVQMVLSVSETICP